MSRRRALAFLIFCLGAAASFAEDGQAPSAPDLVTVPAPFIGITPCRIADTRDAGMPPGYGPPSLTPGSPRSFTLAGQCGIPAGAAAVSLNVTVANPQGLGYVLLYPQGGSQPVVSTLNFVAGQTVANAALVPLGAGGGITAATAVSGTDFIIDTNGYYGASDTDPSNAFVGINAGSLYTAATQLTAIGFNVLANIAGAGVTAAGYHALWTSESGPSNTAIGASALDLAFDAREQVAFGKGALAQSTSGIENVAVGSGALAASPASINTAIGSGALSVVASFSNGNAALGYAAGASLTGGGGNLYVASPGSANDLSTTRIGSVVQTRAFLAGIRTATLSVGTLGVVIDPGGQLGTILSSARYKEGVVDASASSARVLELRPVSFRYRSQEDERPHYGLIAEEVERVLPDLVVCSPSGETETVLYDEILVLILSELRKQDRRLADGQLRLDARRELLDREEAEIAAREREIAELERRLAGLGPADGTDRRR